jgi:hypothetical protein
LNGLKKGRVKRETGGRVNKKKGIVQRRCRIVGGLIVLLCLGLASCFGPKEPPRYLDEGENHLVRLDRVEGPERYDHPAEMDIETLRAVLKSIVVRHEVSFLNRLLTQQRDVRGSAFTSDEVELLAERLKTALAKATPEEQVVFFLTSKKSNLSTLVTSGVAFVKGKEIHLIFANDRTSVSDDHHTYVSRDRPLHSYEPGSFEILPQTHQRKVPAEGRRKVEAIAVDYVAMIAPASEPIASQEESVPPSSEGAELEAQLRLLKKWREERLITEEEYKEKKAELLKTLE